MNELDYHLEYSVEGHDGDNVTTTGSVRYEEKKYAADSSFFTWQSGSWVNTGGTSRKKPIYTGQVFAPGTKNSKLEIGKDETSTDLIFDNLYAYIDDEDDDKEIPNRAYQEYVFDWVWYLVDQAIPYDMPPRPPVVSENSNKTETDPGPNGASITYFDPTPSITEESYSVTHSADWKWETSTTLDPGWNFTYANRETDVGEYMWSQEGGWMFTKESLHQMSLGTGFCIYREDDDVCDTPDCPDCPPYVPSNAMDSSMSAMSATEEVTKSDSGSCCTLESVSRPISVSSDHLESAKKKAREYAKPVRDNPRKKFEAEAVRGFEQAPKMDTDFRSLVAYRSASAHGRGVGVRQNSFNGKINANNATNRANQMENKANATANKVRYTGDTLDSVIGEVGQIEKSIQSAISWADSATSAFNVDWFSDDEKLKYAVSGLEFAAGNLDDAEHYIKNRNASRSRRADHSSALQSLYDSLHSQIVNELSGVGDALSEHVKYARKNAVAYQERAEDRKSDEYLAAAVIDLFYAYAYVSAIPALRSADFDDVDKEKLEVEQELTADHYNRRATQDLKSAERLLMRMASLEYNTGIESFGLFQEADDQAEAEQAYRRAIITEEFLSATDTLYEEFDLRGRSKRSH
ncbi:hypothetical protein Huta_1885 [Halorhabdus utahensis DSM 12940]|uniref:Uncharacterized protein n=1 Tax=Halorhabdus utahensis (strain DSM 12940 / JCM 11049 / AX-2) TaxID=519442 RepID=C7NSG7_HALUD|nr:hypothetical protein [Halorhabdus utahensis]ACV12054.1 hypothetical protein Huta_1885 [Halorhabdus utahensis DSM 12940]